MTTEAKFKKALKEMMLETSLDKINVTSLCKKCSCHRQTFYYHYQDVYDLLASIFLNEKVDKLKDATSLKDIIMALIEYAKANFLFLRSSYNSAGQNLVDDFFYSKILNQLFTILSKNDKYKLSKNGCRTVARRYARLIGDEFGYAFKDLSLTPTKFEKTIKKFALSSIDILFPALVKLTQEERKK